MNSQSVLIIDDDQTFAQLIGKRLARRGYKIDLAFDSFQALQCVSGSHYDWVLLDLKLNDESGLTLLKDLAKHKGTAKVIMMTAFASIATTVEAMKLGADNYLPKPFDLSELLTMMAGEAELAYAGDQSEVSEQVLEEGLTPAQREWELIQASLLKHSGNISQTAKALGMHRRTLQRKLQKKQGGR